VGPEEWAEEHTPFVAEAQISQRRLGIAAGGATGDLQRPTDLHKLRGRTLGKAELELDILMRHGL
jgi:hypothetical protein